MDMKPEPQVFTLEEANALVPQLRDLVGKQLARRADIEDRLRSLAETTGEMPTEITPPELSDTPPVRALKRDLLEKIGVYQEAWGEVERMGAVVKDPRIGLVDFFGHVDGKAVWLCWKYGEDEIAHYHALDEGFGARKRIGMSIKHRLLN
jgi:hypothetical protein